MLNKRIAYQYDITLCGKIFSKQRTRFGYQLKPVIDMKGYQRVGLIEGQKQKKYRVHRLVALKYILNNRNAPTVNHKNGIKTDNRINNLEWMTHKENTLHSFHVLKRQCGKEENSNTGKKVYQYNKKMEFISEFSTFSQASQKTGISVSSISNVVCGKSKSGGGFYWATNKI